ncbi:MAG: UvrD-helicase domain-containing protein [Paludibacter sp.]|nr:UvrD-helicase domain-containing protein [Paludibacter sp.]
MLNIYRASAGSGKTYQLTNEFVTRLFEDGRRYSHRRIMAVTFTNKATEEMRKRIIDALFDLANNKNEILQNELKNKIQISDFEIVAKARQLLYDILHDYHFFTVSTIDRFFQQILRSFAREIGIVGNYNIELDTKSVLLQAADNLLINLSKDENKQLLDWLTELAENLIEQGQSWNIQSKMQSLGQQIFKENFQNHSAQTDEKIHDKVFLKKYSNKLKEIESKYEENVKFLAKNILTLMQKFGLEHEDFAHQRTRKFEAFLEHPAAEIGIRIYEMRDAPHKSYTKNSLSKNKIEFAYENGMLQSISDLIEHVEKNYFLYNSAKIILKHIGILGIISDLSLEISKLMNEQDAFLLSDTNLLINKIIDQSDSPFIYEKTGIFINHFMIDEFQDTSILQWKNFKPLIDNSMASGNANMLVGDVKQSIYRWRNSDWRLLDQQVFDDFRQEQIIEIQLNTNWRSDKNIVEFNNIFFTIAPQILYNELKNNILDNKLDFEKYENIVEKIANAYRNINQQVSSIAKDGHVRFEFLEDDNGSKLSWKDESLMRLPNVLEDLQIRGFQPNRVCILVRTNDEAQQIVQFVLQYKQTQPEDTNLCYDIIGNDGLSVAAAPVVRFIISVLQLVQNPENMIAQKIVEYEFGDIDFIDKLQQFSVLPLFEMVENIISFFKLGQKPNAAVYIQALQDIVYQFITQKTASLNDFLAWWENDGVKRTVAAPEGQRAFRILTVHKAKGLDFDAVILPFADWEMEKSGKSGDIMWCQTDIAPFDELPIFPINYIADLKNSIFTLEYYNEKMLKIIDNLNVAYVAFTRPKHELICFAPYKEKPKKTENISINSLSLLMLECFKQENFQEFFDSGNLIFEIGNPTDFHHSQSEISNDEKIENYPVNLSINSFKINRTSADFWQNQPAAERVNFGKLMHEILQKIIIPSDQNNVLQQMETEGKITSDQKQKISIEMEKFWNIPQTSQWFDNNNIILKEKTILTPEGKLYRPDRIIINGELATVIDYKFGEKENPRYRSQIQQYMKLLEQMNYVCEGFICYVNLQKVEKI